MRYSQIELPVKLKNPVLACGADTKAGFCLARNSSADLFILGGDLKSVEVFNNYRGEINKATKRLKIKPMAIAYDMHPEYFSSKFALNLKRSASTLVAVQHHHAHIAASMAAGGIKEKVIGVAFDGTGFGSDSNIWGGEFLLCDYKGYRRMAHLKYMPLPGGEAAVKEPWRLACAWLYDIYGEKFFKQATSFSRRINKKSWRILKSMIDNKINSPLSSSAGRLFDAVASLIGLMDVVSYEGQAAIELEKLAAGNVSSLALPLALRPRGYKFKLVCSFETVIIDPKPVFKKIAEDLDRKVSPAGVAMEFHRAVALMIGDVCRKIHRETGIKKVALSGGVFQNNLLRSHAYGILRGNGLDIISGNGLPVNDGALALGQALIADAKRRT